MDQYPHLFLNTISVYVSRRWGRRVISQGIKGPRLKGSPLFFLLQDFEPLARVTLFLPHWSCASDKAYGTGGVGPFLHQGPFLAASRGHSRMGVGSLCKRPFLAAARGHSRRGVGPFIRYPFLPWLGVSRARE